MLLKRINPFPHGHKKITRYDAEDYTTGTCRQHCGPNNFGRHFIPQKIVYLMPAVYHKKMKVIYGLNRLLVY